MKYIAALLAMLSVVQLTPAVAVEFREIWNVEGQTDPAADIICPYVRRKGITSSPQAASTLSPPDTDELTVLGTSADQASNRQPLPKLTPAAGRPFAVSVWGDSHTAAGFFTEQLIESLGLSQEDVVPSFLPSTLSRPGVRLPVRKSCRGGPWETELAYVSGHSGARFSRALSAAGNTGPGAYLWIDFRRASRTPTLSGLRVLFSLPPGSSSAQVQLEVDDHIRRSFKISNPHHQIDIRSKKPFSTFRLRVTQGSVLVDGFAPTYVNQPKLVVDTLSIPGATVRAWRMTDPKFLRRWGPPRPYDLALLQYGTNEANSSTFQIESYVELLRDALRGFRSAYPDTRCVMLGPPDRGVLLKKRPKRKTGHQSRTAEILLYSRRHRDISEAQERVGREFGCSFWSWQKVMGGQGGIYRWQRMKPPLASHDLIHLTKQGYEESAKRFEQDLHLHKALSLPGPHVKLRH